MNLKTFIFDEKSQKGTKYFRKMLKLLDSPRRYKISNPDKLLKGSGIQPGQKVLEIGCGSGYFTVPASRLLGEEGMMYAIDIHPAAVEETSKKMDEFRLKNVVVSKEDAMNLTLDDGLFDLVLLYGVVPAPVISMKNLSREIHRVLKPGGICAIWTMAPFWSPSAVLKYASFEKISKNNGVFRLKKR